MTIYDATIRLNDVWQNSYEFYLWVIAKKLNWKKPSRERLGNLYDEIDKLRFNRNFRKVFEAFKTYYSFIENTDYNFFGKEDIYEMEFERRSGQ